MFVCEITWIFFALNLGLRWFSSIFCLPLNDIFQSYVGLSENTFGPKIRWLIINFPYLPYVFPTFSIFSSRWNKSLLVNHSSSLSLCFPYVFLPFSIIYLALKPPTPLTPGPRKLDKTPGQPRVSGCGSTRPACGLKNKLVKRWILNTLCT